MVHNNAFDEIIDINEHIKRIEALSRKVNLEAINSSLSARAVGNQGKGFAVVANELNRFSALLNEFKTAQLALSHKIIWLTTQLMSLEKRRNRLQLAAKNCHSKTSINEVIERSSQSHLALNKQINEQKQQLQQLVRRMKHYCKMGAAISKNGLIEAAHCGGAGASLRKVAEVMGEAVGEIASQLDAIAQKGIIRHLKKIEE